MSSTMETADDPGADRPSGWADPIGEIRRFFRPARERWRAYRNRKLADGAFQARATRFPLTRPFAQEASRRLFDLCAGFVYSQVLSAGVQLGLYEALRDRPLRLSEIAGRLELDEEAARVLLRASASLDLIEIEEGLDKEATYALGALGAALLANPGALAMIRHHDALYADLADPVALLKGGKGARLSRLWPYAARPKTRKGKAANDAKASAGDADMAAYTDLMEASQDIVAREVLAATDLSWARRVLDVGGGSGRFLTAFASHHPDAELHLFDLPAVAAVARQRLPGTRNGRRITVHEGDFFTDPLPEGYDLATLVRIVHDHDDEAVVALLTRIREGLRPGGVVMIAEPMSGDRHSGPVADAYFGFYLRAMGSGRPRTPDEIAALMKRAGLSRAREIPTALPVATKIVVAEIPRRSVAFT
ncbi:acetylserotonin O-methyltransferase [Aurantimonas endophytica]|uniref:Demethylspheroidene O-methyltransferase n=1 Tax=Aurantimonas endophytica TaxID=1522175 RepID=A0A7W6HB14_9HYPH|nr:acetylserotonin O-methyltransferase [Aurantimonas endophytica]MBB4001915.1 demethylspheroidene O-methyltransferase [Aurantimonas endophytica]